MNLKEKITNLLDSLAKYDYYYYYSDDQSVWRAGVQHHGQIQFMVKDLNSDEEGLGDRIWEEYVDYKEGERNDKGFPQLEEFYDSEE